MKFEISIHSLRMEGDNVDVSSINAPESISIHSLRMEGDFLFSDCVFHIPAFQSTPSAWRETLLLLSTLL